MNEKNMKVIKHWKKMMKIVLYYKNKLVKIIEAQHNNIIAVIIIS